MGLGFEVGEHFLEDISYFLAVYGGSTAQARTSKYPNAAAQELLLQT